MDICICMSSFRGPSVDFYTTPFEARVLYTSNLQVVGGILPKASQISTQPTHYQRAEANLLAAEKGPQHWTQVVIWIVYL